MIRKALLIEAGKAKGQKEIAGPAVDVSRLRTWFGSENGGAWEHGEIVTLSNPSPVQVQAAVAALGGAEYAFVSFSGHGYIDQDGRTGKQTQKIIVGTGEEMNFASLRPTVKKVLMVCDACRVVEVVRRFTDATLIENRLKLARKRYDRAAFRSWFEAAVTTAAEGAFTMYGCGVNQVCYDDPLEGGFFTSSLIDSAAEWSDHVGKNGCLAAQDALKMAAGTVSVKTAGKSPPQHPTGGPENRSLGNPFPFAVCLT